MPRVTFKLEAEYEDGTTEVVVADQRDIARWEVWEHGGPFLEYPLKVNLFFRYLAWSALVRAGGAADWATFSASCVEVHDTSLMGDDAEDPGQAAASDGS
jgi:hypothetical protein